MTPTRPSVADVVNRAARPRPVRGELWTWCHACGHPMSLAQAITHWQMCTALAEGRSA